MLNWKLGLSTHRECRIERVVADTFEVLASYEVDQSDNVSLSINSDQSFETRHNGFLIHHFGLSTSSTSSSSMMANACYSSRMVRGRFAYPAQ